MRETKLDRTELVAYLEDNESMDFVEKASAEEEVKGSAKRMKAGTRSRIMVSILTSYLIQWPRWGQNDE